MRALILEQGEVRGALAAARALSAGGWTVGVAAPVARPLSGRSRAVSALHRVPRAGEDPDALVEAINDAIETHRYEVVFSCDDGNVLLLSERRAQIRAAVPYGPHAGLATALDKLALMQKAAAAGLAVPHTVEVPESGLERFDAERIVVKPRHTFVDGADVRIDAHVADDLASANDHVRALRELGAAPLAQEHLEGRLMAFTALAGRDSQTVAEVQQTADATWPPGAGVSTRAHTVTTDEELAAGVHRLLSDLGWLGIANLQFILCEDGIPRLLDFNGRFYGSLALSSAAGLNLPAMWAAIATGLPTSPAPPARAGVRYQWVAGDIRASWTTASGAARAIAVLRSLMRAAVSAHSVWRITDPWPAISFYASKLSRWMQRRS